MHYKLKTIFYQDNSVRWIDIQNKSARIYWMDSLLCHGLKFILLQHLIHSSHGWSSYTEVQFGDKYFRLKYSPFNCIHISNMKPIKSPISILLYGYKTECRARFLFYFVFASASTLYIGNLYYTKRAK